MKQRIRVLEKQFYTAPDLVELFGCSRQQAYNLMWLGVIPSTKIGYSRVVSITDLNEWLDEQTTEATRLRAWATSVPIAVPVVDEACEVLSAMPTAEIGNRLRAEWKRSGIAGKDVCAKVGIKHPYLSRIFAGKVRPSPAMIIKIREAIAPASGGLDNCN